MAIRLLYMLGEALPASHGAHFSGDTAKTSALQDMMRTVSEDPLKSAPVYSGPFLSILVQSGLVWSILIQYGLVYSGPVWSGLVHAGALQSGLVRSSLAWRNPA